MENTDEQAFQAGVHDTQTDPSAQDSGKTLPKVPSAQERADCKRWLKTIQAARDFDKVARKRYALDRRYARADRTKFLVDVPIAQSYIDVLRSFLYAQDPNVDVQPSGFSQPPPVKEIESLVLAQQQQGSTQPVSGGAPGGLAALIQALRNAHGAQAPGVAPGLPSPQMPAATGAAGMQPSSIAAPGVQAAPMASGMPNANMPPSETGTDPNSLLLQQVTAIMKPYQQLRDDSKQLADTLSIVIPALWKKAQLKKQAIPLVNSGLTVGIGWLKAVWLERTGKDPIIQQQIDDIMENLAALANTQRELADGEGNQDELRAQLEQQKAGLEAKVELVVARGFAVDFLASEDVQVSTDARDMLSYTDASWIAHRAFKPLTQAQQDHPDIAENLKSATMYERHKIVDATATRDVGAIAANEVTAEEADTFRKGSAEMGQPAGGDASVSPYTGEAESFVCIWEIWHRDSSMVLTVVEGLEVYATAPHAPDPGSSRFYPFFAYVIGHVDGERHPRSLITRSERLLDEYSRTRSNFAEHRRRSIPKTAFLKNQLDKDNASKLEGATIQEMVGIETLNPEADIQKVLVPVAYAAVDEALYDTSPIRAELEMIWGVQEALSQSIHVPKTATEAQIQQMGSQSRTGYMRAGLDSLMDDLAQYTAEVALQKMTVEDVKDIAGPWSLWPQNMGIDSMNSLVDVSIIAGSTGKPDTAAEQQAWAAILPQLKESVEVIGKLRGSTPEEVADCIEALVAETIRRTGDKTDPTSFLPDPPRNPPPPPPPPAPPPIEVTAFAGPQIQALTAVLADVKGGVLTPPSAIALIGAVAPAIPQHLVEQMVMGAQPSPTDPPVQLDTKNVSPVPSPPIALPHPGNISHTAAPALTHMNHEPMNPRI